MSEISPATLRTATILVEQEMREPIVVELPAGTAVALTVARNINENINQDAAAIIPVSQNSALLVVADGMGGTRNGAKAASIAVHQLASQVVRNEEDDQKMRTSILDGIETANRRILTEAPDGGTTLAVAELHGHWVRPYHIGDSTVLVTGQRGKLKLNTVAHSPVGFAVEAGILDADDALHHDERHIISNALGFPGMRIELGAPIKLSRYDTMIIASDGLMDNVFRDEIIEAVRKGSLVEAVMTLAGLARERMRTPNHKTPAKPDDLTLVAYRRTK